MPKPTINKDHYKNKELLEAQFSMGKNFGLGNKIKEEPVPTPDRAECETIYEGQNNSFVILGRDRPRGRYSGYGGLGATGAGRIDIIAGLSSAFKHKDGSYGQPDKETATSPNFAIDAARIYISQKSDIDRYMGLAKVPGQRSRGRSSIGIKADEIRIHSRRDIKLVTGKGKFAGLGKDGERLSNGELNEVPGTISFIAGNSTRLENLLSLDVLKEAIGRGQGRKLQPITKGDNVIDCISEIISSMRRMNSLIGDITHVMSQMDTYLASHTHPLAPPTATSPNSYTLIATPWVKGKVATINAERKFIIKKLDFIESGYLSDTESGKYINSRFVFTT